MSLEKFYKNKVVLITGASMGIGKTMAALVLRAGGRVIITGRNAARLQQAKEDLAATEDQVMIFAGDVSSYEDNILLMVKIYQQFGRLDVLINNAGMSCYGEVAHVQPEVARQVIDTNIYGSLYPVSTALKHFENTLGSIMFVSSIAGFHGLPAYSAYSMSKRSLQALAQSLRTELHERKIYVGIAYVGFTENETDKKVIAPNGELQAIPPRPKYLLSTRENTARKILDQIKRRRHAETHSVLGKFMHVMSMYFPILTAYIMRRRYKKENQNE
ncbi:MAG TPA: SDR family NAD(P)-dependent oxidoreductase [Cyclobacteriaceae bacterium]|nr:SDR family NAD(P)-dependent oxidoreductase [Cyclobacteriaceae bacterium]